MLSCVRLRSVPSFYADAAGSQRSQERHAWPIISAQTWKSPSPIRSQPKNNWTGFLLYQLGSVSTHRLLRTAGRHLLGKHSRQPLKDGWWCRRSRAAGRNGGLDSSWWRPHAGRTAMPVCSNGRWEPTVKEMAVRNSDSSTTLEACFTSTKTITICSRPPFLLHFPTLKALATVR